MTGSTLDPDVSAPAPSAHVWADAVGSLDITSLRTRYQSGELTPGQVIDAVYERIEARGDDAVWITLTPRDEAAAQVAALGGPSPELPLYGIPFAVKDNIDVTGILTTVGCPDYAYVPEASAAVVARLRAAGAIMIGKTNLDQFATGLSGTRTPYGVPTSAFGDGMIAGGSSSGSAVAVSVGLVSFSLGTDTAGSGRVPAAFNSVVGVKPSRGLVSTTGMVPACRSLDCPSVFSLTVADGHEVLGIIAGPDGTDPWSRALPGTAPTVTAASLEGLTVAVPTREVWAAADSAGYGAAWDALVDQFTAAGVTVVEIDMEPFLAAGRLLYGGPWIAERYAGLESFAVARPTSLHPITRRVLAAGSQVTGTAAFRGMNTLASLRATAHRTLAHVDALVTPTAPTTFTVEQMLIDPIDRNAELGTFATFVNLLDLVSVAVPAGFTDRGLPFGVTVHQVAGRDQGVIDLAAAIEALVDLPMGATGHRRAARLTTADAAPPVGERPSVPPPSFVRLAVVGAHLQGLPLHAELLATGAVFDTATRTAAQYRLFALPDSTPAKPGLVRDPARGASIDLEVYHVPLPSIGRLLGSIAAPLGLGSVTLEDGSPVHGFVCEAYATDGATDITEHGGWRAYLDATADIPQQTASL